jgi:hypothetical protein
VLRFRLKIIGRVEISRLIAGGSRVRKIRKGCLRRCLIVSLSRVVHIKRAGGRGPIGARFQVAVIRGVRVERTKIRMIGVDEARVVASRIMVSRYFLRAEGMVCSHRVAGWWIGISSRSALHTRGVAFVANDDVIIPVLLNWCPMRCSWQSTATRSEVVANGSSLIHCKQSVQDDVENSP